MKKNVGIYAIENALNERDNKPNKGKNVKTYLEAGESVLVRIPSLETCAYHYSSHSDYEAEILPSACHKEKGGEDLFDKASEILLKEARSFYESNPKKSKELWLLGKRLEGKIRMQFGFFSLETGEPVIFDVSKKYGETIIEQIKKYGNKIDQFAFEFSRTGKESNTSYSLSPYLGDLSDEQQEMFKTCGEKEFDVSLYENTLFYQDEKYQIQDLERFGFDVSLLGIEPSQNPKNEEDSNVDADEDVFENMDYDFEEKELA